MIASERYWKDVSEGRIPLAIPFTCDNQEGQGALALTLTPVPEVFANLHSLDPTTRVRAIVTANRTAAKLVQRKFPQVKVVK